MYNMMEVDAYDIIPQYHVIKSIDVQIEPYRPQTCQQSCFFRAINLKQNP